MNFEHIAYGFFGGQFATIRGSEVRIESGGHSRPATEEETARILKAKADEDARWADYARARRSVWY
jgi:hypothetical protein